MLLDFDLGASLFELGFGRLSLVLVNTLFNRLRCRFNDILRLFEAKAGQLTNSFDDLNLVAADIRQNGFPLVLVSTLMHLLALPQLFTLMLSSSSSH